MDGPVKSTTVTLSSCRSTSQHSRLSVVHHVITAHRGTIAIESRAGEGTTVVVRLPA